jgi:heterodisulfide reductase subunit D
MKNYDNPWMQPRGMKERWMEGEIKEGKDVLYLVGCTGAIFPSIPRSTYRLLALAGISPLVLGKEERCCGSILKRIGETQLWEKYAKENIKMLNSLRISTLVTSCAGCYRTIRKEYEEIGELDFDVLHSSQLINEFIRDGMLEFSALRKNVTYHDPCHLGRHSGVYDEPREILRSIPGLSLVEMERTKRNSFCCGAGGGVFSGFPQIAKGTALSRVKEAIGAGAEILLSACPFCYQNLRDAAKGEIEVMDLCELLWNQSRSK